MLIRPATIDDAPAISAFVTSIARQHIGPTLNKSGLEHLLAGMATENQRERLRHGHQFFIAEEGDEIVGTVAIRAPCHLYYLFVRGDQQRTGIGRQLWNIAREWINLSSRNEMITVNSSLNAIAAYERFGFAIAGPIEESHNVPYQPMRFRNATEQANVPKPDLHGFLEG